MVTKQELPEYEQRIFAIFELLAKQPNYTNDFPQHLLDKTVTLNEMKAFFRQRFIDGYHGGYENGFQQHELIRALSEPQVVKITADLSLDEVATLANDYAWLGEAYGSSQGCDDWEDEKDYDENRNLKVTIQQVFPELVD